MTDANGLYYMRARYYSPELKRFINADVVAGDISNAITLNRYAYANGNPVSNVDPFGLSVEREGLRSVLLNSANILRGAQFGYLCDAELFKQLTQNMDVGATWSLFGKEYDIEFALQDSDRYGGRGIFTQKLLSGKIEWPGYDFVSNRLNLFSGEIDFLTGGWHIGDNVDIDLLDIGHAEAKAYISPTEVEIGAVASAWSPGATFQIGDVEISLSGEVGAVGGSIKAGKNGFSLKVADVFGFSIDIKW